MKDEFPDHYISCGNCTSSILHEALPQLLHCVRLTTALFTQGDGADCWFVILTSSSSSSAPGPPSSTPSSLRGQKRRSSSRREKVRPPAPLFCNGDASPPRCSLELFFSAVLTVCVFVCVPPGNKSRRVELSTASLLKVAPTAEERKIVHSLFLNTLDTKYE